MDDWELLIRRHRELDKVVENADRTGFVSDWDCRHPYYKEEFQWSPNGEGIQKYSYIRSADELTRLISDFHLKSDSVFYNLEEIVTSNGSTTIISSVFVWLALNNIKEVYYIPPVYYTFNYFSRIYDINLRPISKSHLFENSADLNLPEKECVLLLTDPIWYAGVSVPESWYEVLADWQNRTGSTIILDGSFQYFRWNLSKFESSSQLDKKRTLRIICPTKAIATHGFRFAYLLVEHEKYDWFDYILDNICGSSTTSDILCAKKCMRILLSEVSNTDLILFAQKQYQKLLDNKVITEVITPDSGYFIFGKLNNKFSGMLQTMDGEYFQQKKYPGYIRINLLSSSVANIIASI